MPSNITLRNAVAAATLLLVYTSTATAETTTATTTPTFTFPACIDTCIVATGCSLNDPKCMCKAAPIGFLDNVVRCIFKTCTSSAVTADGSFIRVMDAGCQALKVPIPKSAVQAAQNLAATLEPKRTPVSTLSTTLRPPSSTSARGGGGGGGGSQTTSRPGTTTSSSLRLQSPTTTVVAGGEEDDNQGGGSTAPPPPATSTSTSTSAAAAQNRPPPSEPTDSSPFATPIADGAAAVGDMMPNAWARLSLVGAVAAFMLR